MLLAERLVWTIGGVGAHEPTVTVRSMTGELLPWGRVHRARGSRHDGPMTTAPGRDPNAPRLQAAIVLRATEDECTVVADGMARTVSYAPPFPRPRAGRVAPGSLVAIARESGGAEVILWRWFDAVVVDRTEDGVTLWEPNHGTVVAAPRDPRHRYRPGSRAYLSAGLPGAEWWVAGPAVDRAESAQVELDEVRDFFTRHNLWSASAD
jgi:hypothetical protein